MEADMTDEFMKQGNFRAKVIFRGQQYGEMKIPGWKEDFQLIHKEDEKFYLEKTLPVGQPWRPDTILPKFVNLPPLLKELLVQEANDKNIEFKDEEMKLPFLLKHKLGITHCRHE